MLDVKRYQKESGKLGMSHEAVARKIEVSLATVFAWVSHRSRPKEEHLKELADLFGIKDWRELIER